MNNKIVIVIKEKIKLEENRRLLTNYISLTILQGANYILPLIVFPYLIRVLGTEKFGLIAFANATIVYFQIISDYGFNLSATKEISINRDNKDKLAEIFSSVITIKLILVITCFILLTILIIFFDKYHSDWLVYYLTFGSVIGQALLPVWFFQGIEKMKIISILNIGAKLIFTISIFFFVKKESDYVIVPFLNSLGFIFAGIIGVLIITKSYNIRFSLKKLRLQYYFKEGFSLFFSLLSSNILYSSPVIILGFVSNYNIVGLYAASEKIIFALRNLNNIFHQVIFPRLSHVYISNQKTFYNNWKKALVAILLLSLIISTCSVCFSDIITYLFIGNEYTQSQEIYKILSFTIITHAIYTMLGLEGLVIIGKSKQLAVTQFYSAILFLVLSPFVYLNFGIIYFTLSLIGVEIFIIGVRFYLLNNYGFFNKSTLLVG